MAYKLVVSQSDHGRRLDKTIRSMWPALPLSVVMKGIRTGTVRLDGRKSACDVRVSAGQELYVPWEAPEEKGGSFLFRRTLPVLYRDDWLMVVNKPENLLVQPDRKDQDNVIDRVKYMLSLEGAEERAYAVHRLDRNTTGALLMALSGISLRILQDAFRSREIQKTYLAVVVGKSMKRGEITAPLLKDPGSNTVRVDSAGKEARTLYRLLAAGGGLSLVELELVTGRSHQARVHMAHAGHPILGDVRYGDGEINERWRRMGVRRPLLHSYSIAFGALEGELEPLSGTAVFAPAPEDMRRLIELADLGFEGQESLLDRHGPRNL